MLSITKILPQSYQIFGTLNNLLITITTYSFLVLNTLNLILSVLKFTASKTGLRCDPPHCYAGFNCHSNKSISRIKNCSRIPIILMPINQTASYSNQPSDCFVFQAELTSVPPTSAKDHLPLCPTFAFTMFSLRTVFVPVTS